MQTEHWITSYFLFDLGFILQLSEHLELNLVPSLDLSFPLVAAICFRAVIHVMSFNGRVSPSQRPISLLLIMLSG